MGWSRRVAQVSAVVIFPAGCFGVTPTPLTRPVTGSLVFLKNGGIYGVFDPDSAAACETLRQRDLDRRSPTVARQVGVTTAKARSALEAAMSGCTRAEITPTNYTQATAWLSVVRVTYLGASYLHVLGARTERDCRDLLRGDDGVEGSAHGVLCQPVRVEER